MCDQNLNPQSSTLCYSQITLKQIIMTKNTKVIHNFIGPAAFLLAFVMPLNIYWQYLQGGWFNFTVPLFVFLIVPLLDHFLGVYVYNPGPQDTIKLLKQHFFQWILWLYVPVQSALILWAAYVITHDSLLWFEAVGITFSVGICSGTLGITIAHELIHRPQKSQRWMGLLLLLEACYMHFYIEHLKGHHQKVATPTDSASARLGESLYQFYWRSVRGSWIDAWKLEDQRLKKKKLVFWRNQMIWFTILPILLGTCLMLLLGKEALYFFIAQSLVAFTLLEMINYVQHYGLSRKELQPGVYEPIQIHHSWNSPHLLTNCFMFLLQRHSDHHKHQSYPYQILRHYEQSPLLPAGYGAMIVLALFPALWRKVMDSRAQHYCAPTSPFLENKTAQAEA